MTLPNPPSFVRMNSKEKVLHHFENLLKQQVIPESSSQKEFSLPAAEALLDSINTYPKPLQIPSQEKALNLTHWKQQAAAQELEKSKELIAQGKMLFWLLWAGEASRAEQVLHQSQAYIFDKKGNPTSKRPSKAFFHGNSFDSALPQELNLIVRQMIQRRLDLEALGGATTVAKTPFIIHLNEDNKEGVLEIFRRYQCFGFSPENILFMIQDGIEGWSFTNGVWHPYGLKRPGGHGYTLLQLGWKNQGFTLNATGEETPLIGKSPLEYFAQCELLCSFPIEDNLLLKRAFDLKRFAAVESLFESKPQQILVLEAMLNLKGQKGGSFLQEKDSEECVMVEKLQLQTPEHQHLFQNSAQAPLLNRNITYIKVKKFSEAIQQEGMYFTFNAKDPLNKGFAGFWPDLVTCIITQSPLFKNSGVFYEEGLAIENFKTEADIPLLLKLFQEQMSRKPFQELWKRLQKLS